MQLKYGMPPYRAAIEASKMQLVVSHSHEDLVHRDTDLGGVWQKAWVQEGIMRARHWGSPSLHKTSVPHTVA